MKSSQFITHVCFFPSVSSVARNVFCGFIIALFCIGTTGAEEPKKIHGECSACHKEQDFKAVKTVINETCRKCHPTTAGKDHPVDIVSAIVPVGLPLGEGNKITCVTCHEPHGKNTVGKLLRKKFNSLCIECHNV